MNPPQVKTLIIDEKLHLRLMKHCMGKTTSDRKFTMREFTEGAINEQLKRAESENDVVSI